MPSARLIQTKPSFVAMNRAAGAPKMSEASRDEDRGNRRWVRSAANINQH
jgi:hypothetical protein